MDETPQTADAAPSTDHGAASDHAAMTNQAAAPDAEAAAAEGQVAAPAGVPAPPHGYTHQKDAYLKRLRRIEGQVRGIARMVEEDKYCIDILTQVSAVNKALHAVSVGLLEEHLGHCVAAAAAEGGDAEVLREKIAEATAAISRLVRS